MRPVIGYINSKTYGRCVQVFVHSQIFSYFVFHLTICSLSVTHVYSLTIFKFGLWSAVTLSLTIDLEKPLAHSKKTARDRFERAHWPHDSANWTKPTTQRFFHQLEASFPSQRLAIMYHNVFGDGRLHHSGRRTQRRRPRAEIEWSWKRMYIKLRYFECSIQCNVSSNCIKWRQQRTSWRFELEPRVNDNGLIGVFCMAGTQLRKMFKTLFRASPYTRICIQYKINT